MAGRLESSARVKAMTREVQKRRANLALSSDLRTGKGNGHGAAVSSLTAVAVEALTAVAVDFQIPEPLYRSHG